MRSSSANTASKTVIRWLRSDLRTMKSPLALTAAKTVIRWLRWAAVVALVYSAWGNLCLLRIGPRSVGCPAGSLRLCSRAGGNVSLLHAQGGGLRRRGGDDRATGSPRDGDRSRRCAGSVLALESRAGAGRAVVVLDHKLHALHPRSLWVRARGGLHFLVGKG